MCGYDKERENFIIAIYNQHWTHARHVENERYRLLASYLVVFGAVIYGLYTSDSKTSEAFVRIAVILLGFVLTLIVGFITAKFEYVFYCNTQSAKMILEDKSIDLSKFQYKRDKSIVERISVSALFVIIYFVFSVVFLDLLIFEIFKKYCKNHVCQIIQLSALIGGIMGTILYIFLWKEKCFSSKERTRRRLWEKNSNT